MKQMVARTGMLPPLYYRGEGNDAPSSTAACLADEGDSSDEEVSLSVLSVRKQRKTA